MKKTTTRKRLRPNERKLRNLRDKYFRDLAALDAKFKADAEALGCIPLGDAIRAARNYFDQLTSVPSLKKYPQLVAQLQKLADAQVQKLKALAV